MNLMIIHAKGVTAALNYAHAAPRDICVPGRWQRFPGASAMACGRPSPRKNASPAIMTGINVWWIVNDTVFPPSFFSGWKDVWSMFTGNLITRQRGSYARLSNVYFGHCQCLVLSESWATHLVKDKNWARFWRIEICQASNTATPLFDNSTFSRGDSKRFP